MRRVMYAGAVAAAVVMFIPSNAMASIGAATAASPITPSADRSEPARTPASTGTRTKCEYKWRRMKVVKRVKRHGKVKRVVRYRWRRVCVPVTVPGADPERIGVKAFEFGFILSTATLEAGDTIAELNNRGEDPHDLHIQKVGGGPEVVFPETLPSSYSRQRFETVPGNYRLWCSLPFHAERGMDATVTVK